MKFIFTSVKVFQKGEGSNGKFLMLTVNNYIQRGGPAEYREAMRLFIDEENQHSDYLSAYLAHHGIKSSKKSVLDAFFRTMRHLGGLKCEIEVLVTAEMIALTYYNALSKCSDSKALRQICAQMLHDEIPHVIFQSYTLSRFKHGIITKFTRRLIMNITSFFVWCAFHKLYHAGGYNFSRFISENNGHLQQSMHLVDKLGLAVR